LEEEEETDQLPCGLLGLTYLHAARMAECAATIVCGSSQLGGRFLAAVADGVDAGWPTNSGAARFARKLRAELSAAMRGGSESTEKEEDDEVVVVATGCTKPSVRRLLRLVTRHGRLAPGIASPIDGPITSCEPLPPAKILLGFYADHAQRPPRGEAAPAAAAPSGIRLE